jgi:hypothetical protein
MCLGWMLLGRCLQRLPDRNIKKIHNSIRAVALRYREDLLCVLNMDASQDQVQLVKIFPVEAAKH